MRRDPPRKLLGADPVDQERQVRPVLLHRAQWQDDEGALVPRELLRLRPRALGEPDHTMSRDIGHQRIRLWAGHVIHRVNLDACLTSSSWRQQLE
jgi:hypothetical protein